MSMTAPRKISTESVSPTELEGDDLIIDGATLLRVVGEPQTIHTGLGPFDDFQLLIRTELENVEDGLLSSRAWPLDAVVTRQSQSKV
jgi:hypothetical protein